MGGRSSPGVLSGETAGEGGRRPAVRCRGRTAASPSCSCMGRAGLLAGYGAAGSVCSASRCICSALCHCQEVAAAAPAAGWLGSSERARNSRMAGRRDMDVVASRVAGGTGPGQSRLSAPLSAPSAAVRSLRSDQEEAAEEAGLVCVATVRAPSVGASAADSGPAAGISAEAGSGWDTEPLAEVESGSAAGSSARSACSGPGEAVGPLAGADSLCGSASMGWAGSE